MWIIEDNILGRWTWHYDYSYETEQEAQVEMVKEVFKHPNVEYRIVEVK